MLHAYYLYYYLNIWLRKANLKIMISKKIFFETILFMVITFKET